MYSIVSVSARFSAHDTGLSLSPPLLSHSCQAKARARWNNSDREAVMPDSGWERSRISPTSHAHYAVAACPRARRMHTRSSGLVCMRGGEILERSRPASGSTGERHWKRARMVRQLMFCLHKHLRWAREPLRKILTQARLKSFLRPRRTCQIAPFIIIHLFEIIYDFTLQN